MLTSLQVARTELADCKTLIDAKLQFRNVGGVIVIVAAMLPPIGL